MTQMLVQYSGKDIEVFFNGNLDGQYRKDGSNKRLLEIIPTFKFTNFSSGISRTYEWYLENK